MSESSPAILTEEEEKWVDLLLAILRRPSESAVGAIESDLEIFSGPGAMG